MKNTEHLTLIICFAVATSWSAESELQFIPICVLDKAIETGGPNRTSPNILIVKNYYNIILSTCPHLLDNIGEVDFTFTNVFIRHYFKHKIDSALSPILFSISSDADIYDISILLSNEVKFWLNSKYAKTNPIFFPA